MYFSFFGKSSILGALLLLFFSSMMQAQEFDWQGHRGARGLLPENSLPAFQKALELGVQTLELDVVISKDSQVVVSHEPWMSAEICSHPDGPPVQEEEAKDLRLLDLSLEEIQAFDCGSRQHPRFPEQVTQATYKPSLREVITLAEAYVKDTGRAPIHYNIEIKSQPSWDEKYTPAPEFFSLAVMQVLIDLDIRERSCIQSFDIRPLQYFHGQYPEQTLAFLSETGQHPRKEFSQLGFIPDIYSPYYKGVDAALIRFCRKKDIRCIPWTVNELQDMERLMELGVDGIITDYPNRIPR